MFFSAATILILFLFLIGVPMSVVSESQQQAESNPKMSSKRNDELATEKIIPMETNSKSINEMNCNELNEFIMSFEKGWGSAVALHDERCS